VRDKGVVKKKIATKNRSFQEVLGDLDVFFKIQGKRLPPGILRESLVTIGVPQARVIITNEPEEELQEPEQVVVAAPQESPPVMTQAKEKHRKDPEPYSYTPAKKSEPSSAFEPGQVTIISDKDIPDIQDALIAVESLSDSFMAPGEGLATDKEKRPTSIKIAVHGAEEVLASNKSTATDPLKTQPAGELVAETAVEDTTPINQKASDKVESSEQVRKPTDEELAKASQFEDALTWTPASAASPEVEAPAAVEEPAVAKKKPPAHAVKPLVTCKAVILGENGVGKSSIMAKAGMKPYQENESEIAKDYIHSSIVKTPTHRIDMRVWSFDDAVAARIARKEFYRDVDVIIIVYSVNDRWSFESIDFWLKEATVKVDIPPPIILAGNKKDIRDSGEPDPLEPAVSSEEGFKLAERFAEKFSSEGKLHPVAFIESSCLTGEGTEAIFSTAAEFFAETL
jgi:GTPase SAR1 family protein